MVFSFFTKRVIDESFTLLIDIGSASVGAARVRIEAGKPPHILATARREISFQDSLSSPRFISAMNRELEHVLRDIKIKNGRAGAPAHIFCSLSSPWFILKSRRTVAREEQAFEVTRRGIEDLLNKDTEKLKQELAPALPAADVAVIERKIIQTKLNGYEIKDLYGKKTTELEVESVVSLSSRRAIESITRSVGHFFHSPKIHFSAFPLAAFSTIRDMFPNEQNFLFLDITGEATDVSLIERDMIVETMLFPRGKNFFIREISIKKRTSHEEAASLFALFLRGELKEAGQQEIENIVARNREEWRTRFEKALSTSPSYRAPIRKIFFTTDADSKQLFEQLIVSAQAKTLDAKNLEVCYLDHTVLANLATIASEVTRDPFLILEALFAKKLLVADNQK